MSTTTDLKFQVKSSGQYLNIIYGGNANGTSACQGNTPTTDNFIWQILDAPNNPGWHLIQVNSSGQYLNIFNGGNANGTRACQGNTPTTDNFLWKFINAPNNPGWCLLQVKSSGQYLNILNGGSVNGTLACQGNTPTTDNFLWKLDFIGASPNIHTVTVSATIANPIPPSLSDDEGHQANTGPGDAAMTTEVGAGDTVKWVKGGNISSLDNVFETAGTDLFIVDPSQENNGAWVGIVGTMPPGSEEEYNITYKVGGKTYTQDPRIRVKPQA
ncbi:RICIN domain-containing protein [Maribacter polysiphoniae]|uniref:RICIN domain-containing protein n=1 Tax=Maribacter polysiphoniae TaxID=429344 RepID=UPI002356A2C4|nr:RICIN domain-containing protein [Maribacter polysiphoniae]